MAAQFGRDVAASMASDMDSFFAWRFSHVAESFLKILRDQVEAAAVQSGHSPILVARVELESFMENVDASKGRMIEEIMGHMDSWQEPMSLMGLEDGIIRLATKRADDFCVNLKLQGVQTLVDCAEMLKVADDNWRAIYPDQAEHEPI